MLLGVFSCEHNNLVNLSRFSQKKIKYLEYG